MSTKGKDKLATILIVDDQEMVRTLVADLLADLDYEVITASDGQDALAIYRKMTDEARAEELLRLVPVPPPPALRDPVHGRVQPDHRGRERRRQKSSARVKEASSHAGIGE